MTDKISPAGLPSKLRLDPEHKWRLDFDNGYHDDTFAYPPTYETVYEYRKAAPDAWTSLYLLLEGWDSMRVAAWPPLDDPHATKEWR